MRPLGTHRLLPLLDLVRHGSRSHATCHYKCGNACDAPVPNRTDNPELADVVSGALSRRAVLRAGGTGALVVTAAPALASPATAGGGHLAAGPAAGALGGHGTAPIGPGGGTWRPAPSAPITFTPVEPNLLDAVITADGYDHDVVIRWGDPVLPGAPLFDVDRQTAAAQARQFGYNCDFLAVLPLGRDGRRALLVVNHEYTNEQLMFDGVASESAPTTAEQKRIAMMAHGLSVVEIERSGRGGRWRTSSRRRHNRRVTLATPMEITGPAAGSPYLRTTADPSGRRSLGTMNNCAGGMTPWGTTLHGEENVNQYFGPATRPVTEDPREPRYARYGISTTEAAARRWHEVDPRFDLNTEPNEPNRFGWVVELDPFDPTSTPKKRTALGRFKHEGANVQIAEDGRVVAYSGDDERYEYIYKFVSRKRFRPGGSARDRAHNLTLLDDGDLYVGQFRGDSPPEEIDGSGTLPSDGEFDGTGRWLPLVLDGRSMVPGKSVAWVLTFTRLAADRLGRELDAAGDFPDPAAPVVIRPADVPTKMDRPEDIQVNPVNGRVYAALTNNSARTTADEANPITRSWAFDDDGRYEQRPGNRNGAVVEWLETDGVAGRDFYWRLFIVAGDPTKPGTYYGGYDPAGVSAMSCPDNVEFDSGGNLWVSTDGSVLSTRNQAEGTVAGSNDGLFAVPTAGAERGRARALLTVPIGAECSGPLITADDRSVFVSVQHPGETTGSTRRTPSSVWPDRLPRNGYPRPSVIVAYRRDGRPVGR